MHFALAPDLIFVMKKFLSLSTLLLVSCQTTSITPPASELSQVSLMSGKARTQYESFGRKAMISSQGAHSTEAAIEVLNKGGNLFDAFTALSFAIGVERPHSTGIGGGGFVLFYLAKEKKVYSLDFREVAPRKASSTMFLDEKGEPVAEKSLTGSLAVAVPGHVAGVLEIHRKFGALPLKTVLQPAIQMAEKGFPIYPALHKATTSSKSRLTLFPASKQIFLNEQGEPWPIGHQLIQKDLGKTLRRIADQGAAGFYQGPVARKISFSLKKGGGLMDLKDLADYKAKWREPLHGTYDQYEIFSQAPPSSGGMHVIEILNMLEKDDLSKWGPQDARSIHLTASAMQKAFFDRAQYAGDPDFTPVPSAKLISKEYATRSRSEISLETAHRAPDFKMKEESPDTTHFSLMDEEGNAIVSTQTINGYFGSAMVAEGTGIVLNNEMDDFAAKVGASNLFGAIGGKNNLIAPGKRPVSSMSPTLVMKDGRPVLAVGTPSGTRIITCVTLTILNVLEYHLPLWDAVSATRYHQQWQPDELQIEAPMFPKRTLDQLQKKHWRIQEKDGGCRIQAIQNENGTLHGVSDPREEGSSVGL
jgi:gamma-glutamyltranspeptidase/glutathione hydrolase